MHTKSNYFALKEQQIILVTGELSHKITPSKLLLTIVLLCVTLLIFNETIASLAADQVKNAVVEQE